MNFFEQQDIARRNTRVLLLFFLAAVVLLIVLTNAAVAAFLWFQPGLQRVQRQSRWLERLSVLFHLGELRHGRPGRDRNCSAGGTGKVDITQPAAAR